MNLIFLLKSIWTSIIFSLRNKKEKSSANGIIFAKDSAIGQGMLTQHRCDPRLLNSRYRHVLSKRLTIARHIGTETKANAADMKLIN